jgi:hypothetical protein
VIPPFKKSGDLVIPPFQKTPAFKQQKMPAFNEQPVRPVLPPR